MQLTLTFGPASSAKIDLRDKPMGMRLQLGLRGERAALALVSGAQRKITARYEFCAQPATPLKSVAGGRIRRPLAQGCQPHQFEPRNAPLTTIHYMEAVQHEEPQS